MQNVRDPLGLAFIDGVPLGIVAGGGKPSVSRRTHCGSIDNYLPQWNRDLVSSRSSDHTMQAETQTENACPSCKALNATGARFCSGCGSALSTGASAASQAASPLARKVCAGCNKINDASAQFCLHCGTRLPAAASVPAFGEPAGFWIRALAVILDGIILMAVGWLVEERLGLPHDVPDNLAPAETFARMLPGLLLDTALSTVYLTVMVGAWGASIGKMVCGLKIVRGDGGRVTYGISLTRSFAELVSLIPLGLGYLWVALAPSKRAWHDYLCDTRVVYKRPR